MDSAASAMTLFSWLDVVIMALLLRDKSKGSRALAGRVAWALWRCRTRGVVGSFPHGALPFNGRVRFFENVSSQASRQGAPRSQWSAAPDSHAGHLHRFAGKR